MFPTVSYKVLSEVPKGFNKYSNIYDWQIRGEKFKFITETNTITYFYDNLVMDAGNILKPFNVIF